MTEDESKTIDALNRNKKIPVPAETVVQEETAPLSMEMEAAIKRIVDRLVEAHKTRIDDLEEKIQRLIANQNTHTDNTEIKPIASTGNDGDGDKDDNNNEDNDNEDNNEDDEKNDNKCDDDNEDNDDEGNNKDGDKDDGKDEDAWNRNKKDVPTETAVQEEPVPLFLEMKTDIQRIDLEAQETSQFSFTNRSDQDIVQFTNTTTTDIVNNFGSTSTNNNDDNNNVIKSKLFKDSSHRYLFMDTIEHPNGTSYEVGWNHKIIAFFVIGFQYFAYYVVFILIVHDFEVLYKEKASPTLEIDSKYCYYDTNDYNFTDEHGLDALRKATLFGNNYNNLAEASITEEMLPGLLKCSNPTDSFHDEKDFAILSVLFITGTSLMFFFVLPDLFEVFILFKCKGWKGKLAGVLIFFKAFIACLVGTFGAFYPDIGLLNVFFLLVGVVFVHEVDEQFGYLQGVVEQVREHYCCVSLQFGVCFVVLFIIPMLYTAANLWAVFHVYQGWNWLENLR